MFEKPPTIEQGPERVPTEAEVGALFERLVEDRKYEEIRKREDEQGLYLWDIKLSGSDAEGGTTEYSYMRAGQHPEGSAARTAIHVAYFDSEGFPIGGESVAVYENGEWH